uniref:hypothetical protein n=1 Tax=Xenorhabdus sp. GDc328 TaxID=742178 RepID=UPI001F3C90E0
PCAPSRITHHLNSRIYSRLTEVIMCIQILCSSYGSDASSTGTTILTFSDNTIKRIDGGLDEILSKTAITFGDVRDYFEQHGYVITEAL